ncbi:glycerol-3-phosphate dehydrogenase [NAD(P)+] [Sphingobium jiangsuense]|uniref:Glycerol-3-phosphate dehydrogenase [NAD(P)+] n=1 Tax=Sphingobium jiangsuense TaxID=870476 RepID=A0A7W6BJK7_9SPHN|nr:NAD(P)H-dependent glycerol-3-phosphate dehydrogenase [Sphingobium jiangsuense]MBB3926177.1 glycerol-3-phosphate dehydrogenase (NAD(P)+) [Sphingobium jiangsuense]GLT02302.1 glycerol-3-phosphate dehydrogenase [NAD(P)+] [Sphingobium jiangsuense]
MKIGVVGAGAWGTALAQVAAAKGDAVTLWALEPEVVASINDAHENSLYLPGVTLSPTIRAVDDLAALADCDALLVVVPAQHLRAVLRRLPRGEAALLLCAKGIEAGSGLLVSQVAQQERPDAPIAVLSGPTFAHEVAAGLPTAVTLACADAELGQRLVERIALPAFRPYLSDDVIGAEVGGAVKNVLAIACGVAEGAGMGLNARASLISRGFAEMTRFGRALGARAETLSGLSGLGDLVLTCSSTNSRNFSLGKGLGEGARAADLLANRRTVAEGAFTAPVLRDVARRLEVEMPIVEGVCALLEGTVDVADMTGMLLARPLRSE